MTPLLLLGLLGMLQEPTPPVEVLEQGVSLTLELRREAEGPALPLDQTFYRGEVVLADLILRFAPGFRERQLVERWRSPLDLQVGLQTPWADSTGGEGWELLPLQEAGDVRLVVDREQGLATALEPDARGWEGFRVRRRLLLSGQTCTWSPARLELVWATRFRDDLVRGKVPLDRKEDSLSTDALRLPLLALPDAEDVEGYRGAIGRFRLQAELLEGEATDSPETVRLRLTVTGAGHLTADMLPDPTAWPGVHRLGSRVEFFPEGATLFVELQVDSGIGQLPSLAWSSFEPGPEASYRTQRTPTLALPGRGEVSGPPPLSGEDRRTEAPDPALERHLPWFLAGALLLLFLLWWRPRHGKQESHRDPNLEAGRDMDLDLEANPYRKRVHGAPPAAIRTPEPKDLLDDLALLLTLPRSALYHEDLAARLAAEDLPDDLVRDLSRTVEGLKLARFAGSGQEPEDAEIESLRQRLRAATLGR